MPMFIGVMCTEYINKAFLWNQTMFPSDCDFHFEFFKTATDF